MWKRLYLVLVAVRFYFALQPSYIHPDEHFQGPEIIASEVFGWPAHKTWEFTSDTPIRSIFPLWLVYGFPLTVLKWLWEGMSYGDVPPIVAFYALRILMFILSFVLEDWAIYELVSPPRERNIAIAMVASSYVTWTFQTHTFSNALETILVLWCTVLMKRISESPNRTMARTCAALAFLGVLGTFNRITFPAFLVIPAVQLLPHLFKRVLRIPVLLVSILLFLAIGITTDTEYYTGERPHIRDLRSGATFTPWNNLVYNFDPANLANHGLHPFWQHFLANLPQLIGPAFPLLLFSSKKSNLFWTAITGVGVLSCFQHQEPRFLLPAIPLLLASINIPSRSIRAWASVWLIFNLAAGVLFGVYHQGGVVPAQTWLQRQSNIGRVYWWKSYSPPLWLLDGAGANFDTVDLMGRPGTQMIEALNNKTALSTYTGRRTLLVAPASAIFLDQFTTMKSTGECWTFQEVWRWNTHIGLDDLDFGDDGIGPTLQRVVGRRGLVIWEPSNRCR